ncbi:hypothetical protein [Stappia sp.]|uniref:hypothetical protein n=1 Tax=Stappia sp. TaxID=1870903 RepID=UPI0025D1D410|nr:hypothetical protein [Stappia sp.]
MQKLERMPTREEFGQIVLRQRETASQMEQDALAVGDQREAKAYAKIVRKYDKMISDYGLGSRLIKSDPNSG